MRPVLVLITIAALAVPSAASASTARLADDGSAVFISGAEASDVTDSFTAAGVVFDDALQTVSAGDGCVAGPPVACPQGGLLVVEHVLLGGGDDRFRSGWSLGSLTTVSGGSGDDDVRASAERNQVSGGPGDDDLRASGNSASSIEGAGGDDRIYGTERAYDLHGGPGDDLVVAAPTATPPGATITGDGGADRLVVTSPDLSVVSGGPGTDVLVDNPNTRFGAPPRTLDGGSGSDIIAVAPSDPLSSDGDTVFAGLGHDVIGVYGDGRTDEVNCGPGFDVVFADPADVVAGDCELRFAAPLPSPAVEQALADAAAFVASI
jgi:hypothetical protein